VNYGRETSKDETQRKNAKLIDIEHRHLLGRSGSHDLNYV
jgi:hypothetical protein